MKTHSEGRTELDGVRCAHQAGHNQHDGKIGVGSGRRSLRATPVKTLQRAQQCRQRWARGGFGRQVVWHQHNWPLVEATHWTISVVCRTRRYRALWVKGQGIRAIARHLGRAASTISREVRRNAATRSGGLRYRATTAQWHAERAARRPKVAKMTLNPALQTYVQDRLAGRVTAGEWRCHSWPSGVPGRGAVTAYGSIAGGLPHGVQNRFHAVCTSIFPRIPGCVSVMKPSTRRSISRAEGLWFAS